MAPSHAASTLVDLESLFAPLSPDDTLESLLADADREGGVRVAWMR